MRKFSTMREAWLLLRSCIPRSTLIHYLTDQIDPVESALQSENAALRLQFFTWRTTSQLF